jgi:hypothetical protein
MNSPDFFESFPVLTQPMVWSIGGFTLTIFTSTVAGAPFAGQDAFGPFTLSGNGFDPSAYPLGLFPSWIFNVPPYDDEHFTHDVTGPIDMTVRVDYENGHVPDTGNTLALLSITILGLVVFQRKVRHLQAKRGG